MNTFTCYYCGLSLPLDELSYTDLSYINGKNADEIEAYLLDNDVVCHDCEDTEDDDEIEDKAYASDYDEFDGLEVDEGRLSFLRNNY